MVEPAFSSSSSANVHHNASVLPTLPSVNDDEDEPPSSGPRQTGHAEVNIESEKRSVHVEDNTRFPPIKTRDTHYIAETHNDTDLERIDTVTTLDVEKQKGGNDRVKVEEVVGNGFSPKPSKLRALFTPAHDIGPRPTYLESLKATARYTPLNILLACIPVAWTLYFMHLNPTLIFVFACLGIVPLAALLGLGTEQIALRTSQSVGGLLNATLGNIVEMIIAGIALKKCELALVQSSLLGGLLSNLLLVLGMAFVVGGFKFQHQEFQPMVAQLNSSLLILAVISLIIPVAFHLHLEEKLAPGTELEVLLKVSRGSAILLMLIYFAYLFFQFYSHNHLFLDTHQARPSSPDSSLSRTSTNSSKSQTLRGLYDAASSHASTQSIYGHETLRLNLPSALGLVLVVTALAYVTAECLVHSLDGLVRDNPGISKEWITLIIIPVISNAAEHATAVVVARKGKFDLAMSVAVGSCIQIALFVIPLLVIIAWGMDKPLLLLFDPLETVLLFFSVLAVKFIIEDGKSHWMSGLALISIYVLIALSFWFYPDSVRLIQGKPILCTI